MKIAVVASEAAPFVKTGGLGDVMQALPLALSQQKNTYVSLFIPYYSQIKYSGKWQTEFLGAFDVPLAWRRETPGPPRGPGWQQPYGPRHRPGALNPRPGSHRP